MFLASGQAPQFARIAERHPQLILIIDHMGLTADAAKNMPEAIEQTVALAKYPNVRARCPRRRPIRRSPIRSAT